MRPALQCELKNNIIISLSIPEKWVFIVELLTLQRLLKDSTTSWKLGEKRN